MIVGRLPILALALVAGLAAGCAGRRATFEVSLAGTPAIQPFVVHGNCLAGWTLHATLVVRETGDADLTLDRLAVRVEEPGGRVVAHESLDRASLGDRYGEASLRLEPGGTRALPVALRVDGPMAAAVVAGELRGLDRRGEIRRPFRFATTPVHGEPPDPGGGGACPPD